jgi:DNA replication and repair protein RecF
LNPGLSVFVGENAQGKTNLLEAIYLLSSLRDPRASSDLELINRQALEGEGTVARVTGEVSAAGGPFNFKVEVVIASVPGGPAFQGPPVSKTVRINGLQKPLGEAVGLLAAVLFSVRDLDLITGAPALRRRYLDLALSQAAQGYLAARRRFDKVLQQRNYLLKRIRDGLAGADEMEFWDSELAKDGGHLFWVRASFIEALDERARGLHVLLGSGEALSLAYSPAMGDQDASVLRSQEEAGFAYLSLLRETRAQQVAAGVTLFGPHRDDFSFALDGVAAAAFSSRAQQRSIALALRLAEAQHLRTVKGDAPVLLVDDIFSELDAGRRKRVFEAIVGYDQVLITTTEADRVPSHQLATAALYSVSAGLVEPA